MIRYVHLPPHLSPSHAIQKHINNLDIQSKRFTRARLKKPTHPPTSSSSSPYPPSSIIEVRLPLAPAHETVPEYG